MDNTTLCRAGGLIAEYTFDNDSGSTINDTSGNGKHGTGYNVAYVADMVGNGLKGNGSNAYALLPVINLKSKTYCCFMQLASIAQTQFIMVCDGPQATCGLYGIYYDSDSKYVSIGAIGIGSHLYTNKLIDRNFYCAKHTSYACKIRRNAEEFVELVGDSEKSDLSNGGIALLVNRNHNAQFSSAKLDQLRFFDRELEDYEVDNLYNGGAGC